MNGQPENAVLKNDVFFFKAVLFLSAAAVCFVFFCSQLVEAFRFPMWVDEIFGLHNSIRSHPYLDLILRGAQGQGSPAPLDYLIHKAIDSLQHFEPFDLPPQVYYRLFPNFITTLSVLAVIMLCSRHRKSKAQLAILYVLPICFLSQFQIYKYAHEMRPYALWLSLYFVSLVMLMDREEKKDGWLVAVLTLLALTATASLFQIGCAAICYLGIKISERINWKEAVWHTVKIFGIPLAIAFYYCLRAEKWNYGPDWAKWENFFAYWSHQWLLIPFMLISATLFLRDAKLKMSAVAPLSLLLIYLLGPAIFWLTRSRGFFYADRQYLYYELARPVFLLCLAKALPSLVAGREKKVAALITVAALFVSVSIGVRSKYVKRFNGAISNTVELFSNKVF